MRKFLGLTAIMCLILASLAIAVSDEQATTASVTVNEYVSITLSDPAGSIEVAFGSLNPGASDNPDSEQNQTDGAITVTNDAVSNVDIDVDVKGTDFSDGTNTITVSKATYDDDGDASQGVETGKTETALASSYPVSSYYSGVTPGSSVGFWFFLDVPSGQTASTGYQSTFTFRGTT